MTFLKGAKCMLAKTISHRGFTHSNIVRNGNLTVIMNTRLAIFGGLSHVCLEVLVHRTTGRYIYSVSMINFCLHEFGGRESLTTSVPKWENNQLESQPNSLIIYAMCVLSTQYFIALYRLYMIYGDTTE